MNWGKSGKNHDRNVAERAKNPKQKYPTLRVITPANKRKTRVPKMIVRLRTPRNKSNVTR